MNIFNLFGHNKPKKDLYWEFNEAQHFRPKLDRGDFFKLTGFDFGWFILEPISEYIQDTNSELSKGKNLSYGQKALYYWWYIDAQVNNGGFTQYYYNDYGKYTPTIIKALKYIGDDKMAELVNRSYELYLKENRKIKDARLGGWEEFSNLYKEIKDFDDLDNEYYNLNNQTMKNIENYIRYNPNEICFDEEGNEFDLTYSGDLITFHANKGLKEKIPLLNGVVSGILVSHFENGKIKEEIHYLNGEQTGERIEYDENGNKKYIITKEISKSRFKHLWFYANGNTKKLEHKQLLNDERIGEYKEWHDNRQLYITATYTYKTTSEFEGEWLEYHKNGTKKLEAEFKNGNFIIHNCWNEKGKQTLKEGTGFYVYYYSSWEGYLNHNEHEYKNYKRNGKQYNYTNGRLSLYQEMINGNEHGVTKSYDDNENLEYEAVYENGVEKLRKEY